MGIFDELARFAATGPTQTELARGRAQAEAAFVFRIQTLGGFGGKADQLNAYLVAGGDPDYFAEDLARFTSLSPSDVQAAIRRWLPAGRRVELIVAPEGRQ